uniref:maltotransferase domain-containing protein n=1 Tax=Jiella pelagia TaxID=2986949 RepID=UPI002E31737D|nr:maltotransferase domain-containing protein [Jiella pelagia]
MADADLQPKKPKKALKAKNAEGEALLFALAEDRVAIEGVEPEVDGGRFAVKRATGEPLTVSADIFCDGHDKIDAALVYGPADVDPSKWSEARFEFVTNDRWQATVTFDEPGPYRYSIIAWRDLYATWRDEAKKKRDAGKLTDLELIEARELVKKASESGRGAKGDPRALAKLLERLEKHAAKGDHDGQYQLMQSDEATQLLTQAGVRTNLSRYPGSFPVWVDRERAAFSAWYEIFPRSQSGDVNRHGTFDDVIARLPDIAEMGFDVLYFPPIHPIGSTNKKGKNNTLTPSETDPGSPYAIGSKDGGHDAIHPEPRFVSGFRQADRGIEKARARDRHRFRHPVLARPSLDQGASGMVRLAAGRDDQVRRKSAEEIRGHRQRPFLSWRAAVDLVRAARHRPVLAGQGCSDLPGRQSAHQAVPLLGVDDRGSAQGRSGRHLPRRGLHPAEGDEAARQGRLQPVLFLLHLAECQGGAGGISDRADDRRMCRIHAAEFLRQHAGHQPALSPDVRTPGISHPAGARRRACRQLRHLFRLRGSASSCPCRARRSISTRRNTRSAPSTGMPRGTSARTSPSSTSCATTKLR